MDDLMDDQIPQLHCQHNSWYSTGKLKRSPEDHGNLKRAALADQGAGAESMGFEALHGIVDCLWVIGDFISVFKETVERRRAY
jgi:hypothetical protein